MPSAWTNLAQVGRGAGRTEEFGKGLPAGGRILAGGAGDPVGDEFFAIAVVDDIGPVFVEETKAALGHGGRLEGIALEIGDGFGSRLDAIEIGTGGLDGSVAEGANQALHLVLFGGESGVETSLFKKDIAFEGETLVAVEDEASAEIGGTFGDEGLRAIEGVNGVLAPALRLDEAGFEESVIDVVTGVAFVAGEMNDTVNIDGLIDIDLDDGTGVSFVPVVGAPGFPFHVFDGKVLIGRKVRDPLFGAGAGLGDSGLEDSVNAIGRDSEAIIEFLIAFFERAGAREGFVDGFAAGFQLGEADGGGRHLIEHFGFGIEGELFAHQHTDAGECGAGLDEEVVLAVEVATDLPGDFVGEFVDFRRDLLDGAFGGLPFRGSVEGVDVVRIMLPDGQYELDVAFGEGVHFRRIAGATGCGERQKGMTAGEHDYLSSPKRSMRR